MKFLFCVDASPRIGMGHLRRTLALAKALKARGHACTFMIRPGGDVLPFAIPFPRVSALGKRRWDAAIVDSYTITPAECRNVFAHARKRVFIDDGQDRHPETPCDILIDHNVYGSARPYARKVKAGTKVLAGPQYAMTSGEFLRARNKGFRIKPKIRKILLSVGGGDCPDHAQKLLGLIAQNARNVEVLFITPRKTGWEVLEGPLPGGSFCRIIHAPPDVGAVMRSVDLAISAAGVTCLELACVGLPAIYFSLAPNQDKGAQAVETYGIGFNLGRPNNWTKANFRKLYRMLGKPLVRKALSQKAQDLVDGKGTARICMELEQYATYL